MKRLTALVLLLVCMITGVPFAQADGTCTPAAGCPPTGSAATTTLSTSGIAFVMASSGTMGNNGAITAMTALPRTISEGCWLWLPAGSVAAGVPAAASWLWFVGSSTTAGTVYNSTYTSGQPTVGVQTAFVTTGPGAFTGETNTATGPSITLPANTLGINGTLTGDFLYEFNNTAGTKTLSFLFGSTAVAGTALTTQIGIVQRYFIANRGLTNRQTSGYTRIANGGTAGANVTVATGTENTAANVTVSFTFAKNTATDHLILEGYSMLAAPQN